MPWEPKAPPSSAELVAGAFVDAVRRPTQVVDQVRGGLNDALNVVLRAIESAGTVVSAVASTAARPAPVSPLNAEVGSARWWVMVSTDLEDYRAVRKRLAKGAYAEDVTINDVVLATITGGFRSWLLARGEPVHGASVVRAMVPVSIYGDDLCRHVRQPGHGVWSACRWGSRARRCDCTRSHSRCDSRWRWAGGRGDLLANLAVFAPPTLHALGARLGSAMSRSHNVDHQRPGTADPALRR